MEESQLLLHHLHLSDGGGCSSSCDGSYSYSGCFHCVSRSVVVVLVVSVTAVAVVMVVVVVVVVAVLIIIIINNIIINISSNSSRRMANSVLVKELHLDGHV